MKTITIRKSNENLTPEFLIKEAIAEYDNLASMEKTNQDCIKIDNITLPIHIQKGTIIKQKSAKQLLRDYIEAH